VKLSERTLEELAKMVVGDAKYFPYRSSQYITKFFKRCGLPFEHDGSTRPAWAQERLAELNLGTGQSPELPSDDLCRVISELFDPVDFERFNEKIDSGGLYVDPDGYADLPKALERFNRVLQREGLAAYVDDSGRCFLRTTGSGISSASFSQQTRPQSKEEIVQRQMLSKYLDEASEDDVIEKVLVPLFQRLGFRRVSATGHKDKLLEFGKDLWMKFQIPTGHWLYFCAQVKKDKVDSNNASKNNVSNVLNQARMAIDHPIFDPEVNRKVLLDHIFIISAKEITKPAKEWLVGQLDASQRRHIIFMDREELLNHAARILIDLRFDEAEAAEISDDDIPF
jgi:hypothetical protein